MPKKVYKRVAKPQPQYGSGNKFGKLYHDVMNMGEIARKQRIRNAQRNR